MKFRLLATLALFASLAAGVSGPAFAADDSASLSFKEALQKYKSESTGAPDQVLVLEVHAPSCPACANLDKSLSGPAYDFLKDQRRKLRFDYNEDNLFRELVLQLGIRPPANTYPFLLTIKNGKPVGVMTDSKAMLDEKKLKQLAAGGVKNLDKFKARPKDIKEATATSTLDVASDEIKKGAFKDDAFGLPWSTELTYPPVPAQCADRTGADAPWKTGYREAMAGQRFILETQDVFRGDARSTQNPARRACENVRALPGFAPKDLDCCINGFRAALPALKEKIQAMDRALEGADPKPELSERQLLCRSEYNAGRNLARNYCEFKKEKRDAGGCFGNVPVAVSKGVRYLGCFSLGFQLAFSACDAPALQLNAAAACDTDGKAKVPSFTPDGQPAAPAAGAGAATEGR